MKLIFASLAATLASALTVKKLNHPDGTQKYAQNGIFMEKNFSRTGSFMADFQTALDAGFNRFYVGFYMANYGCQAGCLEWTTNFSSSDRANVKSLLAQYNAKLILSIGGPGELWENCIDQSCGASLGKNVGAFAAQYSFDGIELSVNLQGQGTIKSPYYQNGSFNQMCKDIVSNAKVSSSNAFSRKNFYISAGAPYFSDKYADGVMDNNLVQLCLDTNESQNYSVGYCNLVMFDEDSNYMTYQDMFIENGYIDPIFGTFGLGSAVKEIMALGVTSGKIGIVKPTSPNEPTVRSGYINPTTLGAWGCQANSDLGWTGGFIAWTWNDVVEAEWNAVNNFIDQTSYC